MHKYINTKDLFGLKEDNGAVGADWVYQTTAKESNFMRRLSLEIDAMEVIAISPFVAHSLSAVLLLSTLPHDY
jgi:hypothetical protein